jgi:hypothetical protein
LKNNLFRTALATVATVGIVTGGLFVASTANAADNTVNVDVNVMNVSAGLTASKVQDRMKLILCRIADVVTTAPRTPTGDCRDYDLEEATAANLQSGAFSAQYALRLPSQSTKYGMYLKFEKSSELGYTTDQYSWPVINTLSSSTTSLGSALNIFTLENPSTPSTGRIAGLKVAINFTVTGVPAGMKVQALKELVSVCAVPLAIDVTTVPATPGTCSKSREFKPGALDATTGIYTGTYQLSAPATAGHSANYAVYLQTKRKSNYKLNDQVGPGQLVTVTNNAGAGVVTAGLDGLTLNLAANTGTGAIQKTIPIVVPAVGTYAVLITRIDGSKETPVSLIPVTNTDTQVTIPSALKGGNYRVQVVATSAGDTFTIDGKGYLDGAVQRVEGRESR